MEQGSDKLMWGLIGCAGFIVLGMCTATGVGAYLFFERSQAPVGTPVAVTPATPYAPVPQPGPVQPGVPPINPSTPPNPALPPPPEPPTPMSVVARVDAVTGSAPVAVGATCNFNVERHSFASPPGYWCRAQIRCNGVLLYGAGTSGYFQCTLGASPSGRTVVGSDGQTTSADTDASMTLSTVGRQLTLRDDASGSYGAYTLSASITTSY